MIASSDASARHEGHLTHRIMSITNIRYAVRVQRFMSLDNASRDRSRIRIAPGHADMRTMQCSVRTPALAQETIFSVRTAAICRTRG